MSREAERHPAINAPSKRQLPAGGRNGHEVDPGEALEPSNKDERLPDVAERARDGWRTARGSVRSIPMDGGRPRRPSSVDEPATGQPSESRPRRSAGPPRICTAGDESEMAASRTSRPCRRSSRNSLRTKDSRPGKRFTRKTTGAAAVRLPRRSRYVHCRQRAHACPDPTRISVISRQRTPGWRQRT